MAALAGILLLRLGATPIYILDEAKNAQCAREMMQRNDWIVPTFNGELRTDKPPLHYFFMIIAYNMFGETAFAARFFSVIMGLLTVLITYVYVKRHSSAFNAFCAALVLACSTHFLFEFRLSVPDPYLIFFMALGMFSGYTWLQENNTAQLYLCAAALGLATLAKGPVAVALPGLCLLVWVIIAKKWTTAFTWHLIPAFLLLCCITLPWYYAVHLATDGAWTEGFFIKNNLNRFADPQEGHGGFFLLTVLFVLIGLLPFMSFLGDIVHQRKQLFTAPIVSFGALVTVIFTIFFSLSSTKLPNYPMPCYPFAAVVIGAYLAGVFNGTYSPKRFAWYFLTGFTIVLPIGAYFAVKAEPGASDSATWLAALLVLPALLMLAATMRGKFYWPRHAAMIMVAFVVLNICGLCFAYPELYQQNPVTKTIAAVQQAPAVLAYDIFNPGYRFYLDKNIPRAFNRAEMQRLLDSTGNALVITRTDYLDSLSIFPLKEIARHRDIFELPTTVILEYHARPE